MRDRRFQGVWKTGVLAAAITVAGGVFVMMGGVQITRVIPQIIRGGGYRTLIQIINPGAARVTVRADFYSRSGSLSTIDIRKDDLQGNVSMLPGSMKPASIPGGGILLLDFENTGEADTNWGLITSDGPVTISAALEFHDASGSATLVGLETSPPDMKRFVIPRIRNRAANLDIGFAVVNTGPTEAAIDVTLRDASNQTLGSKTLKLQPKEQTALFAYQFFEGIVPDGEGTTYSYLDFRSSSAQFAASASIQGAHLHSLSVERIQ